MKKIMMMLCMMFVLVGCVKEEKKDITDNPTTDTQTSETEYQTNQTDENDSQTKLVEMPTLKTVAKELGISIKDMNILEQTDNHLVVSFNDNDSGIFEDQARKLEKDGYQLELYDATISSTFVLK